MTRTFRRDMCLGPAHQDMLAYVRVSTGWQAAHGYGLDAQRRAIRAYALPRGWQLGWITDGGYSAGSLRRPGLEFALNLLADGQADGLIVSRLDRLSRSLRDFADIIQRSRTQHWKLICIDPGIDLTTPTGELAATILAAVAQWEGRIRSERIREGLAATKRPHRRGTRVQTPIAVARRIHREFAAGRTPYMIAQDLNREHVPTAFGRGWWHPCQVQAVATRPITAPIAAKVPPKARTGVDLLTSRQQEVGLLIKHGYSIEAIALQLGVTPSTIRKHIYVIKTKLDITDWASLKRLNIPTTRPSPRYWELTHGLD